MTAALHADFVDLALDNALTRPGALTVLGAPIDLGEDRRSTPTWSPASPTTSPRGRTATAAPSCFGGTTRFVLSTSGHIAALVNPPGNPKATFHTNDDPTSDAKVWLKGSDAHQGTWWTDLGRGSTSAAARNVRRPRRSGRTA